MLHFGERQSGFARWFWRFLNSARQRGGAFQAKMSQKSDQRMGGQPGACVVVFLRRLRQSRLVVEGGGAHAGDKIHKKREPDFIKQFAQDHFIKKRRRK